LSGTKKKTKQLVELGGVMFHIGEDYVKTFTYHFNSEEARVLFEKAKEFKNAEQAIFIRKQKRHKRRVWLCLIAVFAAAIYFGRDMLPALFDEVLTNITEQGWVAIAAILFIGLAVIRASRRSKAEKYTAVNRNYFRGEYVNFYTNQILPWLIKPLNINNLRLVINEGGVRKGRTRRISPHLKSVNYRINGTQVQLNRVDLPIDNRSVVKGSVWRTQMSITNPLPYDIRIVSTEGTMNNSLAPIKLFGNDAHKFEFNTIEMAKKFECYISIGKGRKTDNLFDEMFEAGGVLGTVAGAFAQKAKKAVEGVDINLHESYSHTNTLKDEDINKLKHVSAFTESFLESAANNSRETRQQKMEDNHLDVHRVINPTVEDSLIFIRRKYGPYNITIGKGIQIDIASEPNRVKGVLNNRKEMLSLDLFTPSLTDDSDISYERLLAIYEIFFLGYLLDKHFNEKE